MERAAADASSAAADLVPAAERSDLAALRMTVIGPADGLDVDAFRAKARGLAAERFGDRVADYYEMIGAMGWPIAQGTPSPPRLSAKRWHLASFCIIFLNFDRIAD